MKFAMSMIAVAGIAAAANAATSSLNWQVSVNGGAFANTPVGGLEVAPGSTVTFRVLAGYSATGGSGATIPAGGGLAGFNFLPTLSSFTAGDTALALGAESFPTGSANNPVALTDINHDVLGPISVYTGTLPVPGRNGPGAIGSTVGRRAPFGANGTNANGIATASVAGNTLSWRAGVIGGTGVSISQLNAGNSNVLVPLLDDAGTPDDTSDDSVNFAGNGGSFASSARANLYVFSYSVVLSGDNTPRELTASSSMLGGIQWFTSASGASASHADSAIITTDAVIYVVPAPGALALLGLSGLVVARRRR